MEPGEPVSVSAITASTAVSYEKLTFKSLIEYNRPLAAVDCVVNVESVVEAPDESRRERVNVA